MATWEISYGITNYYVVTIEADNPQKAYELFEKIYETEFDKLESKSRHVEVQHYVEYVGQGVDPDVLAWEERNI